MVGVGVDAAVQTTRLERMPHAAAHPAAWLGVAMAVMAATWVASAAAEAQLEWLGMLPLWEPAPRAAAQAALAQAAPEQTAALLLLLLLLSLSSSYFCL